MLLNFDKRRAEVSSSKVRVNLLVFFTCLVCLYNRGSVKKWKHALLGQQEDILIVGCFWLKSKIAPIILHGMFVCCFVVTSFIQSLSSSHFQLSPLYMSLHLRFVTSVINMTELKMTAVLKVCVHALVCNIGAVVKAWKHENFAATACACMLVCVSVCALVRSRECQWVKKERKGERSRTSDI